MAVVVGISLARRDLAARSVWAPPVSYVVPAVPRSSVGGGWAVGIVERAIVADQFGLCEGGRLLVTILRFGYEGLERGQLLDARGAAVIRV